MFMMITQTPMLMLTIIIFKVIFAMIIRTLIKIIIIIKYHSIIVFILLWS